MIETAFKGTIESEVPLRRKPKRKPPNALDKASIDRVQAMIAAQDRGLKRLRRGREQALETARVFSRIRRRAALEFAESSEESRRVISHLNEVQRTKERELREWVESIKESGGGSTVKKEDVGISEKLGLVIQSASDSGARLSTDVDVQGEKSEKVFTGQDLGDDVKAYPQNEGSLHNNTANNKYEDTTASRAKQV